MKLRKGKPREKQSTERLRDTSDYIADDLKYSPEAKQALDVFCNVLVNQFKRIYKDELSSYRINSNADPPEKSTGPHSNPRPA